MKMRSVTNKQPADSKKTFGGMNKQKGSNSPTVTVTRKYQPGKTVPAGGQGGQK
jgi:hypothetical protein